MNNNLEPYELLGAAVVKQAVEDYEDLYIRYLLLNDELTRVHNKMDELDRFFESEWSSELVRDRLDPIAIREKAVEIAINDYGKNKIKYKLKYAIRRNNGSKKKESIQDSLFSRSKHFILWKGDYRL